jgi:hypothetical protein
MGWARQVMAILAPPGPGFVKRCTCVTCGAAKKLPKAVICDGCGRTIGLGSAEIPCATCGATMTLPAGADQLTCPFCQSQVRRAGIR